MKFFVISDTHGKLEKVYEVYHTLSAIDAVIHLGDLKKDAFEIQRNLGIDVISVKGNMDDDDNENHFKILDTECGKLYLTHGHLENVKNNFQNIFYKAEESGCIAALFGHTHKPIFAEMEGIHLINPGSLSLPSDCKTGSYAIVNTTAAGISGQIHYYCGSITNTTPKEPSKVQGGYLRGLLNHSDRF